MASYAKWRPKYFYWCRNLWGTTSQLVRVAPFNPASKTTYSAILLARCRIRTERGGVMRKRAKEVKFRVTEQEWEVLQKKLQETGISRNEYLVKLITDTPIFPKGDLEKINQVLNVQNQQLRGIATNINQMTKMANVSKALPTIVQLDFMRMDVYQMRSELMKIWTVVRKSLYGDF